MALISSDVSVYILYLLKWIVEVLYQLWAPSLTLINMLEALKTLLRMSTLYLEKGLLLSSKTVSCTLSQVFNYEMIN